MKWSESSGHGYCGKATRPESGPTFSGVRRNFLTVEVHVLYALKMELMRSSQAITGNLLIMMTSP